MTISCRVRALGVGGNEERSRYSSFRVTWFFFTPLFLFRNVRNVCKKELR